MKRPNAILHMILWGIGSGVLLGASYAVIFALLISLGSMGSGFDALVFGEFVALTGFGVFFGALYGAPLGLVLGILTGFALREKLNRGFELPLTDESLLALRKSMDITIAAVAFFGTAVGLGLFFGLFDFFLVLIPAVISAGAATFAARRYLWRITQRKIKRKHEMA